MKGILTSTWVIPFFASQFLCAQTRGTIHGTVVDETGNTVQGATLYAHPQGPMAMIIPHCITGADGSCTISNLTLGPYFVYAGKPQDGYPDLAYSFYQPRGTRPMEALVSEEHPASDLVVHLGAKAGILKGTVADAVTGKSLDANAEFRWLSDPDNFIRGSGMTNATFRVLVPSDTALKMVVSLDGYEDWVYGVDGGQRGKPLLLHPGQEETLEIRLRPKSR